MKTLKKELQKQFATLPSQYKYEVYNIAEKPEKFPSLTPDLHYSKLQLIHRLLLVTGSQKDTATNTATNNNVNVNDNDHDNDNEKLLLSGIEVYEYTTKAQPYIKTVYISKIDTTGSTLSRGVTRRLVQAYISTQITLTTTKTTTCNIHVFARSQPQYLFTNSAKNKNKNVLNDRQLVGWWRMALSDKNIWTTATINDVESSSDFKIKKFWIIPGIDDEHTALLDIKQKDQIKMTGSNDWKYGYPYDAKALAKKVIPRFEDDGKSRYIASLTNDDDDNHTVEDFWMMFGYSEECGSGKLTGIFVIQIENSTHIKQKQPTDADESGKEEVEEKEEVFSNDQYTAIWNQFLGLEFNNDEENKKSTNQFLKQFEKEFKNITTHIITNNGTQQKNEKNELTTKNQLINTLSPKRKERQSNINVLSPKKKEPQYNVLIPKRRKTDS